MSDSDKRAEDALENDQSVDAPQEADQDQPQSEEELWAEMAGEDDQGLMSDRDDPPEDDEPEQDETQDDPPEDAPKGADKSDLPKGGEPVKDKSDDGPEWWKGLPDDAKDEIRKTYSSQQAQFQNLQQQYQALHGRLAPAQRENEQLKKRQQELEKKVQAYDSAPTSIEELEKLESFRFLAEDSPDDADALKKAVGSLVTQRVEEARSTLDETTRALESLRNQTKVRELQRLNQAHPDWQQKTSSQEFQWWIEAQPPQNQQQIQQMLSSPFADENVQVLNAFEQALEQVRGQSGEQQAQKPPSKPKSSDTKPQQTRQRPRPTPPPQGSGISGAGRLPSQRSEEELWAERAKELADKPVW